MPSVPSPATGLKNENGYNPGITERLARKPATGLKNKGRLMVMG
jgi:hypothetical protein